MIFKGTSTMNNQRSFKQILFYFCLLVISTSFIYGQSDKSVAQYDVVWNTLGTDENSSMPFGNGDVALNVWTEQNGDIILLIAKSDAWSENGELLKLGRVRVSLEPNPFVHSVSFTQTLKLETGEVELRAGNNFVRIWVDANRSAAHVQVQTEAPAKLRATSEVWRTRKYHLDDKAIGKTDLGLFEWGTDTDGLTFYPDTILPARDSRVSWCHFNTRSIYPMIFEQEHLESLLPEYPDPLMHRCFGITMKGDNLVSVDNKALASLKLSNSQQLDIYALTEQTGSIGKWRADLDKKIDEADTNKLSKARKAHEQWWTEFWSRSWINVTGSSDADNVSQGYAIERFMTACAGRGVQPIKFNGSLFTVGHDLPPDTISTFAVHDPDYRRWGACYWNQNTRLLYWPLVATGDYDLLRPWFDMYLNALPMEKARTWTYYHHDGASFPETMYFWGLPNLNDFGWNNPSNVMQSRWQRYHIQGALEVALEMLDYYENTEDTSFAHKSIVPFTNAILTYYYFHYPHLPSGKIQIAPAQSLETYQFTAINPTPDIAGLEAVILRLMDLPKNVSSEEQREFWARMLGDLPHIPIGKTAHDKIPPFAVGDSNGMPIILPAEAYGNTCNVENAELYVVYPYRLYGVGKPDLQLVRNTFNARLFPMDKVWGQDGTEAAVLGLPQEAQKVVVSEFTNYSNARFRWFWKAGDEVPDVQNAGTGMIGLQLMLMQCDGKRIQLLPAWPKDWSADFKLHAPYKTVVEGHVEDGKITRLKVTPKERTKDVIIVNQN